MNGCDRLTRTRGNVRGRERVAARLAAEVRVWREYVGRVARGRRRRCGAGATVRLDSACHTAYRPLASPAALIRRRRARHCEKTFNNSFFITLTGYDTINVHMTMIHLRQINDAGVRDGHLDIQEVGRKETIDFLNFGHERGSG